MNTVIMICLILITVSLVVMTVFFVMTLIQLRKTAFEIENALRIINADLQEIGKFSKWLGSFSIAKLFSALVGLITLKIFRRKKIHQS